MLKLLPLILALFATNTQAVTTVSGELIKWHPMHIDVQGPTASEADKAPNPFLDIRLDITLTSPSGESHIVPGFFAGNGNGVGTGNIWRVRFAASEAGTWQYLVGFRQGNDAAVHDEPTKLATLPGHGDAGEFVIAPRDDSASGFLRVGRLEYVGEHYLKFADGPYFIKSGVDSPENLFGYAGFDNTVNQPGGVGTPTLENNLHHYAAHIADYETGDPNFTSLDTGVDGKGIIGAVNYLSKQGINSSYFLPMNLGGDARDTYPFINPAGGDENNSHYDVSKLYQWNIVLDHMQRKGVAAHIVLNEQETGNTEWLDGGELGTTRKLFYRELIARFAYLNAVKWNLSEESRHGTERHIQFARFIRSLDWAQHPVGVHTFLDNPDRTYDDLLGLTEFDITSIQFSKENANLFTEAWRTFSQRSGWPWVIDMDEVGPGGVGLTPNNTDDLRTWVLYPVYFSGGNLEWYFGYHSLPLGGDMQTEDFRQREGMFQFTNIAREFIESNLPFWEMAPDDESLSNRLERDQVFALAGSVYAVYLANGESGRSLQIQNGNYELRWFNPRSGEYVGKTKDISGTNISLGAAPADTDEDWVILIRANGYELPVIAAAEPATTDTNSTGTDTTSTDTGDSVTSSRPDELPDIGAAGASGESKSGALTWQGLLILVLLVLAKNRRLRHCFDANYSNLAHWRKK